MDELLEHLGQLFVEGGAVLVLLGQKLLPLLPLALWIVFWLFAVNWVKLRQMLLSGGWIGLLLLGLVMVLVWGCVAPPPAGSHNFLGLTLSNFVGKTVLVTGLISIMLLCGSVQLSGICGSWCRFEEETPEDELHAAVHGHSAAGHGGH